MTQDDIRNGPCQSATTKAVSTSCSSQAVIHNGASVIDRWETGEEFRNRSCCCVYFQVDVTDAHADDQKCFFPNGFEEAPTSLPVDWPTKKEVVISGRPHGPDASFAHTKELVVSGIHRYILIDPQGTERSVLFHPIFCFDRVPVYRLCNRLHQVFFSHSKTQFYRWLCHPRT